VLVIVKHRNLHARAQGALDVKAIGRFDVFQVNAAKSGLHGRNRVYELVKVVLLQFDVKHINACKFFKQNRFAFHHRLGGQWANVTQAQNRGAVGDDGHQITPRGVARSTCRVCHDSLTRCGNAR
jgi:hypothetical protein